MTPQEVVARFGPPQKQYAMDMAKLVPNSNKYIEFEYNFNNRPFNANLTFYTDNPRLGRVEVHTYEW